MKVLRPDEIKNVVRKEYANFAMAGASCCPGAHSCCGSTVAADEIGKRIGVDMTADMLSKARENAVKGGYTNVEF